MFAQNTIQGSVMMVQWCCNDGTIMVPIAIPSWLLIFFDSGCQLSSVGCQFGCQLMLTKRVFMRQLMQHKRKHISILLKNLLFVWIGGFTDESPTTERTAEDSEGRVDRSTGFAEEGGPQNALDSRDTALLMSKHQKTPNLVPLSVKSRLWSNQ